MMAGNGALSFKVMDWDRLTKDDIVGVCAISPEKLVEVSAMPPGETMVQHLRILTRGGVPTLGKDKQPTRLEVRLSLLLTPLLACLVASPWTYTCNEFSDQTWPCVSGVRGDDGACIVSWVCQVMPTEVCARRGVTSGLACFGSLCVKSG